MPSLSLDLDVPRLGVTGGARLRYEYCAGRGTQLSEQWVKPPLHLSKAYHEDDWAISLLTSPTAGLLDGDLLEVNATIEAGARAALISPAACRVHTMESGFARVKQNYIIGAGSVLDVWPAPLILQKNSSVWQTTQVDMSCDSTLLLCEIFTPGRSAFGEAFEFSEWRSNLRIRIEGELIAYENFNCRPKISEALDWQSSYPCASYASLYFMSPEPLGGLIQSIHDIDILNTSIGASSLRSGGLGIKVLAADGICLRKAIYLVRNMLITHSNIEFPKALQRAQTFFN